MAYETKDLSGSLFQNKEKKTDNHPDYSGSARIDGHDYWISGWRKVSGNGTAWLSLSLKRKDGTADRPAPAQTFSRDLDDSDIPF